MATQQKLWNPRKANWLTLAPHAYSALIMFSSSKAKASQVLAAYTQLPLNLALEIVEHNWDVIKQG